MTPTRLRYAFILGGTPLILGLILDLSLQGGVFPNPLLEGQITIDRGTLVLLGGGIFTGIAWAGCLFSWYWLQRSTQTLAVESERYTDEHHRFIRRLEHEMKTPLAILQVSLSNLDQQYHLDTQEKQTVHSAIVRLHRLIRDLRKLADLRAYSLEQESIDLAELLKEATAAIQSTPEWNRQSVSLITSRIPWSSAFVKGDQDLLMLAFYNLLDNACKFTHPGDAVEVRIREDGTMVTVDVADNGQGIAEEDMPYIFEELYRGKNAKNTEGNGLGLVVVKKIVEYHSGYITVRSQLNRGTVFTVQLPQL